VIAGVAYAQEDLAALNAEVERLYRAGKYPEATEIIERMLAIRENALWADHPDVGQALNNLALLYQDQGRYAEAEPLLKRSLGITEKALGPDHPDVGHSLNNLALLYKSQGRYAEAGPLFKRSLAIWERALGPEHPSVGISLNNLAELYREQGRYAEAEPALEAQPRHQRADAGARPPRSCQIARQPGFGCAHPRRLAACGRR
jgi:tetratricopeptide (TPR) repeat protein